MSSIKDFELAQRIHVATHELKARIAALEAEVARLTELDSYNTDIIARFDAKLTAAEAERDALHELLRSIVYRLNGGRDATSIAIIVDCDAAIDAARSKP